METINANSSRLLVEIATEIRFHMFKIVHVSNQTQLPQNYTFNEKKMKKRCYQQTKAIRILMFILSSEYKMLIKYQRKFSASTNDADKTEKWGNNSNENGSEHM